MEKQIILIIVLVCMVSFAYAQDVIEAQAGINLANLSDPGNLAAGAKWSTLYGFVGSVSTRIEIGSALYLVPGIRFVQKGTKSEWTSPFVGNVNSSVTMNYLELPVYLKYMFNDKYTPLFLIGGPSISYLISSRTKGTSQLGGSTSYDSKADYKSIDATIDLGLSASLPLNEKLSLVASAIYSFGFLKISSYGSNEMNRDFFAVGGVSYSLK